MMTNGAKLRIKIVGTEAYVVGPFEPHIPVLYSFDLIEGAGVIVLFPNTEKELLNKPNLRIWAAEYMAGYCAFWHVESCVWLHDALPRIRKGETCEAAMRTAAYMCERIAADIAAGRDVRRYPRFYLCRNLQ